MTLKNRGPALKGIFKKMALPNVKLKKLWPSPQT